MDQQPSVAVMSRWVMQIDLLTGELCEAELAIKGAATTRAVGASFRAARGISDAAARGKRTVRRAAVTESIEARVRRGALATANDQGVNAEDDAVDSVSHALVPGALSCPFLYSLGYPEVVRRLRISR